MKHVAKALYLLTVKKYGKMVVRIDASPLLSYPNVVWISALSSIFLNKLLCETTDEFIGEHQRISKRKSQIKSDNQSFAMFVNVDI